MVQSLSEDLVHMFMTELFLCVVYCDCLKIKGQESRVLGESMQNIEFLFLENKLEFVVVSMLCFPL